MTEHAQTADEPVTEPTSGRTDPPKGRLRPVKVDAPPLLCACLAWFDEPTATLERCIGSLAGVCDSLVALDGRWEHMPGDRVVSSAEEAAAIEAAAAEAGLELLLTGEGAPFESQVEKRAKLMRLAARTGATWLLVIDADESLDCHDPAAFRAALEGLDGDVANLLLHTDGRLAKQRDRGVRRVYRAATAPTVEVAHNGYRAADGRWLHGDPLRVNLEPAALELEPFALLVHHVDARPRSRQKAAQIYRMARRSLNLERWTGRPN